MCMAESVLKPYGFQKQLAVGKAGERKFSRLNPGLEQLDGRRADFRLPDGRLLELKTDTYDMAHTPNFFMERYSDLEKKTPGGPWQSAEKGVDVFVYWYPRNGHAHWFNCKQLVFALNSMGHSFKKHRVLNKGYRSEGLLVPRYYLQQIYDEVIYGDGLLRP